MCDLCPHARAAGAARLAMLCNTACTVLACIGALRHTVSRPCSCSPCQASCFSFVLQRFIKLNSLTCLHALTLGLLPQQALQKGTTLHMSFYQEADSAAQQGAGKKTLHITQVAQHAASVCQDKASPDLELLAKLMAEHHLADTHR